MQEVLDEVHPGTGVLFGRCGWSGQQATGITWGGDQVSDFWSLRTLVAATLTAAASGFSNWSHDVGGYLGKRLVERCPRELLLRWVQFGCFTPLMQAHGRFEQEAWRYDDHTLDVYRELRAPARAAGPLHPRRGGDRRALRAADHPPAVRSPTRRRARLGDRRRLRVRARRSGSPRCSSRARPSAAPTCRGASGSTSGPRRAARAVDGGREPVADAPRERIPVWVRAGSIVVTYPAEHVAAGLGDLPEAERPLEATLWGEPALRAGQGAARRRDRGSAGSAASGRSTVRREVDFRVLATAA